MRLFSRIARTIEDRVSRVLEDAESALRIIDAEQKVLFERIGHLGANATALSDGLKKLLK